MVVSGSPYMPLDVRTGLPLNFTSPGGVDDDVDNNTRASTGVRGLFCPPSTSMPSQNDILYM